jgi:hypothetical protein
MDTAELDRIIRERLDEWRALMVAAHQTPAVLVAFGHDQAAGAMGLYTPKDLTNPVIAGFLRWAVRQLDPVDDTWAVQTIQEILDHLHTHAHQGCTSCTAWVRGHGGTVSRG